MIVDETTNQWPALPYEAWKDTAATLQLWLQIVGKVRVIRCPWINHSWHVTFAVSARGLVTPLIPHGEKSFQVEFDFIDHQLRVNVSAGGQGALPLAPQTTAVFYRDVMDLLMRLQVPVTIHAVPNELPQPIPFEDDQVHRSYDRAYVTRYWHVLRQAQRVLESFRARFIGKCSPVHFFWGSADLAVTRFSGRTAPPHPGGVPHLPDWVAREAYSHEVASCGFWAGNDTYPHSAFYAYAYPEPRGYAGAPIRPSTAHYDPELREFVLPYAAMRAAPSPDAALLDFLQTTYEAAANLGNWDRAALERSSDSWARELQTESHRAGS
jgi:hypothetical protein